MTRLQTALVILAAALICAAFLYPMVFGGAVLP